MLEKFTLKSQILGLFITLTTITLVIISAVSINNFNQIGDTTVDTVSDSLKDQISSGVMQTIQEQADVYNRLLENIKDQSSGLVNALDQIFVDDVNFTAHLSYFDMDPLLPGIKLNSQYGQDISLDHSSYYLPDSNLVNINGLLTENVNDTIDKTSILDNQLKLIYNQVEHIVWITFAFDDTSLVRRYPGGRVTSDRTYNPLSEDWYTKPKVTGKGSTYISSIFQDSTGFGWLIRISQPIYSSLGDFKGVVAIDYAISNIQSEVGALSFLKTGYSAMISDDGTVWNHPGWSTTSSNTVNILELEKDNSNLPLFSLDSFVAKSEGQFNFESSEGTQILSFARIQDNILLLSIISEKELVEVVGDIQSDIQQRQVTTRSTTIILSLLTLLVIISLGTYTTLKITAPIDRLTNMANYIAKNVTERNAFKNLDYSNLESSDDEIGELTDSFKKMIESMKQKEMEKKEQ